MDKLQVPNSKVTDGLLGGAIAAVGLGTIQTIWPDISFPPGYEAGVAVILATVLSYMMPERRNK